MVRCEHVPLRLDKRNRCKDCNNEAQKLWRKNNPEKFNAIDKEQYRKRKAKEYYYLNKEERNKQSHNTYLTNKLRAIEYLGNKCKRCKEMFIPAVYDFHHINKDTKSISIGNILKSSWKKIEEELKKCILLCSNCHRTIHHENQISTS